MAIRAVLWDADGVLQQVPGSWAHLLADIIGKDAATALLTDVWPVAQEAMRGRVELHRELEALLEQHGVVDVGDLVREVWGTFDRYEDSRALVSEVRGLGLTCHLATNQDQLRTSYMRERLGYDDLFDSSFYSCEVGIAKPDPAYFRHIADDLGHEPAQLLFIDDTEDNVRVARELGLVGVWWHARQGIDVLRDHLLDAGVQLTGPDQAAAGRRA